MAFKEPKNTSALAHKNTFQVSSIEGSTVKILWQGESLGIAESEAERLSIEARESGSQATIALDGFRLDLEKVWVHRSFTSRAPSNVIPLRRLDRPQRILYLSLEFPTWNQGAHSWSYAASLAYAEALAKAGAEVTVINSPCVPYHEKILRGRRFDQVWFHCHPRHMDDFGFRQWVSDIAPIRLMLCGESVSFTPAQMEADPWFASHVRNYQRWLPHVTHVAFVDPDDAAACTEKPAMWWKQAVPRALVRPVNRHPRNPAAVFVGTLYAPRDRWVADLGGLIDKVESPESDVFQWTFEKSHEWIQQRFDRAGSKNPWWGKLAHGGYNRLQGALRRHAFGNFLASIRQGVAVVNLPSMVKTYSGRVLEGMAAGRPVLTPAIGKAHQFFEDDVEILHYRDAEELAYKIRLLKASPEHAIDVASRARAAILRDHTVETRAAQLLDFTADRGAIGQIVRGQERLPAGMLHDNDRGMAPHG